MTKRRDLIIPAVVIGILLIVVAIVYFTSTAAGLPSFFPGHVGAGNAEAVHHHTKHGIAALVVGLLCLVFAWFQTGPKSRSTAAG
jgi:Na+-driven multidrug efflux pump